MDRGVFRACIAGVDDFTQDFSEAPGANRRADVFLRRSLPHNRSKPIDQAGSALKPESKSL